MRLAAHVHVLLIGLIGAMAALSTACVGPAAREAAHAAAPAVVDGAVEGVAKKENQQKLADGIDERAVETIAERLSGALVDGTMRSLSDHERRERIEAALRDARVPVGIDGAMDVGIAKIDERAVARAVAAATDEALGRVDETKVRGMVRGVVDEAVRTAFAAAREELRAGDAPTETQVASLTRGLSREATLGFQDAVDQVRRKRDQGETGPGEGSVLWAASRAAESGNTLLDVWKVSLIVVGLVLVAGLVWAVRQHRAHRRELRQRDDALALLTKKVEETARRSVVPRSAQAASVAADAAAEGARRSTAPSRPHFA